MDLAIQFILQLTPFANIHAMDDYAEVLTYLVEYWEWDIEAVCRFLLPISSISSHLCIVPNIPEPKPSYRQRLHSALCTRVSHHGRMDALRLQWVDLGRVTATYPCHWSPYFCHPGCYSSLGRDHHPQHGAFCDRRLPCSCMRAHSGKHVSCTNIPMGAVSGSRITSMDRQ
ncbi:hypothetical protein EDD17DRAFT_1006517 [Pisolithus thermaeus]|nr:hypothetical protein EDD17DRAFT_1006517 [Pisolithus thermaeus]